MAFWLYLNSFVSGAVGALIVTHYGNQLGFVDRPNERSSHTMSTPKGGGIGILVAFAVSSLVLKIPLGFWLSAAVLALVSLYGDRSGLSPKFRLPVQFAAAIAFLSTGLLCDSFLVSSFSTFFLSSLYSTVWILFLVIFIVGTANLYNFMDGINGIATITGIVGFGLLALYGFLLDSNRSLVILSVCISLSCLGFLPFNMPRAKVFMGDVGSIFLGFAFAGMVVVLSKGFLDFVCLTSFLFPFYADELTTMAFRIKAGENLMRAHRRHLYQVLANEKGISHWKVSVGYGLLQLVVGVSILLVKHYGNIIVLSLLAAYFGAFILVSSAILKNSTASA